ncbi:MAG: RNA methyltransferase [Endomicrobiales bacterium]|nr:RNA methyltransferase [Endomicrobiales bacterium]
MKNIESKNNQTAKYVRELLTDKKFRRAEGKFVLEGPKFLNLQKTPILVVVEAGKEPPLHLAQNTYTTTPEVFKSISDTQTTQGILAVFDFKVTPFSVHQKGKMLLLDSVQDPGNLGAAVRSAVAFGFNKIILFGQCADPFSPKAARASAGAVLDAEFFELESASNLSEHFIIVADASGESVIDYSWPNEYILAIGSEGSGISDDIKKYCKKTLAIPIDNVESLNAAVSTGILLFCAAKNRHPL